MMHCTIGDVRDKFHHDDLPTMRWDQQFRLFKVDVIDGMQSVRCGATLGDKATEDDANRNEV